MFQSTYSTFPLFFVLLVLSSACSGTGPGGSGEAAGGTAGSGGVASGVGGTGSVPSGGTSGSTGSGGGTMGTGSATSTGGRGDGGGNMGAGGVVSSGGSPAATGGSSGGQFTLTSAELLAQVELGWNLGNSLDAPEGETAWGNPLVTPQILQAVADRGFEMVRIPVTWSLYTGPGPAYTIESSWLDRVEEVVGYAMDAGLYAIINVHHDGADAYEGVEWLSLNDSNGAITAENNTAVQARFEAVWGQIAARFANHGEQLLFESMNEIHDGYDEPEDEYYTIINNLNQVFVNLVRSSGGNNAQRHLVVPGYNTNIDQTLDGFVLPTDTTPNRLILSVHYYDPYTFALNGEPPTWGASSPGSDDWGQEDHVTAQFDKLKTAYIDQGLPMIIGEYGATHSAGNEEYRRYYMEYVTKAAVDRGLVPVYWDNGGTGSGPDNFALFDRSSAAETHPNVLDAMFRAATSDYRLEQVAPPAP